MGKFKKFIRTPYFGLLLTVLVIGSFVVMFYLEHKKNEYVKSLNMYELFIYKLEESDKSGKYVTIKDLVEEHMTNKRDYGEIEENISAEDFAYMKKLYNESIEELYFEREIKDSYDLDDVIEQAYSDEYLTSALDEFLDIQRELLEPELEKKIYTVELEQVVMKEEQDRIAWEKEFKRKIEEEKIYEYMKSLYKHLTNSGENYNPEIHDSMVLKSASEEFGISENEANRIYIEFEWNKY